MSGASIHILRPDEIDFSAYLKETESQQNVRKAAAYIDEIIEHLGVHRPEPGLPLPWEKVRSLFRFRPGEVTLWAGVNGHGKALALETPIRTTQGWKTMGDIAVGDVVFDESGRQCNVTGATEVMAGRPCYEVEFSDGTVIVADANHQWLTKTQLCLRSERNASRTASKVKNPATSKFGVDQSHKRTPPAIVTTREIAETASHKGVSNHAVPVGGAIELDAATLPIDPYVLGAWLGDGGSNVAQITSADQEIIDNIEAAGYPVKKLTAKYLYGIGNGLNTALRLAGLIRNKHVPRQYLDASATQRLAILQGLMDTDGCVTSYGRCEFTNTNKALACAVQELALSLGIIATLKEGRATLYGKDCGPKYRVTFTTTATVFRLTRKASRLQNAVSTRALHRWIVRCEPVASVPVRCIEVDSPSHLYLASHALIPTHNSLLTGFISLDLLCSLQKVCIASFEMKPRRTLERMLRQWAGYNPAEFAGHPDAVKALRELYLDLKGQADGRLWFYDQQGTVSADQMISVARYCGRELGIQHLFVDSLMKCVAAEDDYNGQKRLVDEMTAIARDYDMHIHLVHHIRKLENEAKKPDKSDVKGSGAITDQVDNVLLVWRNKAENRKEGDPDAALICCKQRNGEWEGGINLWFHPASQQYLGNHGDAVIDWSKRAA